MAFEEQVMTLVRRILSSGLARENALSGASSDEIMQAERALMSRFPASYVAVMRRIGRSNRYLLPDINYSIEDTVKKNQWLKKYINIMIEDGFDVPHDLCIRPFFAFANRQEVFWIVYIDDGDDPPVYYFHCDDAEYFVDCDSIIGFFNTQVEVAVGDKLS